LERANESQAPFVEGVLVYAFVGRVFLFLEAQKHPRLSQKKQNLEKKVHLRREKTYWEKTEE
jgi:hypothetical protein